MKTIPENYKISILTTSDFPYKGAAENFVRQMSLGIFEQNVEVEVIRFWGDRYLNKNDTPIKCSNYLFSKPWGNEFLKFFELLFQILYVPFFISNRKFLKKDKAIIFYGLDRGYILAPLIFFSKIISLKCFRIITEIYLPETYAAKWWRKSLVFFDEVQRRLFDRYMDGIVVLSRYLYNICLTNKVKEHRLIVIPHFIHVHGCNNLKQFINNRDEFIILYCGTCTMENGITDLLQAYIYLRKKNLLANSKLKIIGSLDKSVSVFISQIESFDKISIEFMGELKTEDVKKELCNSSVLVNPRRQTILADSGFPTKLGEYFAAQVPVITTKIGDLKSYFKDKQQVIFAKPNDYLSLANEIRFVFENRVKSHSIGLSGYAWAVKNLDYKTNALTLLSFVSK